MNIYGFSGFNHPIRMNHYIKQSVLSQMQLHIWNHARMFTCVTFLVAFA